VGERANKISNFNNPTIFHAIYSDWDKFQIPSQNQIHRQTPPMLIKSSNNQTKENSTSMFLGNHAERTTGAVVFTVTGKDPLVKSSAEAAAFQ
jgi:hypothetical protein